MVFVAKDLEDGIGSEKKARITKYVERFKDLEFISGSFDSTKILLDKRLITPEHVMNNLNRNLNSLRILEERLGAEGKKYGQVGMGCSYMEYLEFKRIISSRYDELEARKDWIRNKYLLKEEPKEGIFKMALKYIPNVFRSAFGFQKI